MKKILFSLSLLLSTVAVCNVANVEFDIVSDDHIKSVHVATKHEHVKVLSEEELAALTEEERTAYFAKLAAHQEHVQVQVTTETAEVAQPETEAAVEVTEVETN